MGRLSLEQAGKSICGTPYSLLALDGKIIPGQTAIECGEKDRWGTYLVHVIFEIQEDKNDES